MNRKRAQQASLWNVVPLVLRRHRRGSVDEITRPAADREGATQVTAAKRVVAGYFLPVRRQVVTVGRRLPCGLNYRALRSAWPRALQRARGRREHRPL